MVYTPNGFLTGKAREEGSRNLLAETLDELKSNKKSVDDIDFIGSSDGEFETSFDQFRIIADREYYAGYGGNEVCDDLIIHFKDGSFMSRGEYDGSEWWDFTPAFKKKKKTKPIYTVFISKAWCYSIKENNIANNEKEN